MGTLAEALNAPATFDVKGHEVKLKRISITAVFKCIQDGLTLLDPALKGLDLQDKAQECLESGRFPLSSIETLLFEAMKDCGEVSMADAVAVTAVAGMDKAIELVRFAIGMEKTTDKEAGAEGNVTESPSTGEPSSAK